MRAVFALLLFVSFLFSSESVKQLLNEIEKNEDLSLKTKQESAGISYIITRYQLDMMQARYLRDVLKNTLVGYKISRYGVLDPWSANNLPYASSGIRIFIDNQEITTAKYDNGLFLLDNINLSFVDHIEIYYLSPSYKISTEPAYVIIKLYSKNPQRDEGHKISASYGTYGSNSQAVDYANAENDTYAHFSKSIIRHKDTVIDNTTISRNNANYHFLWTYKKNNTRCLFNAIYQHQDPFMGLSMDGALQEGYEKYKEAHFGVEHILNEWNIKYTVDYLNDKTYFYEDSGLFLLKIDNPASYIPVNEVKTDGYDVVNTLKINRELNLKKHRLVYGFSIRDKRMDYTRLEINGNNQEYTGMKAQKTASVFLEDNIQMKENYIVTFGYELSRYFNDVVDNYTLQQYKFTNTFLADEQNIFKFSLQHLEYIVPPYLYKTFYAENNLKPQENDVIIGKYKKHFDKNNDMEIVAFYGINKNFPVTGPDGSLESYDKNIYVKMLDLKYHKNYNVLNDLIADYIFLKFDNIALNRTHKIIVLNTHRYKKFDFFENIVYLNNKYIINGQSSIKTGLDLSLGVKYSINHNLSLSLKGENLFSSSYENSFIRITGFDPSNTEVENVQLTDRKVTLGMEYWF